MVSAKYDEVQPRRKSGYRVCILLTVLTFLLLIGVANLVFLVLMYSVLDVNENGMQAFTFFKDANSMRWLIQAEFDNIVLHKSQLDGFSDQNLYIQGADSNVEIRAGQFAQSEVSLQKNGSFIKTNNFRFVDPFSRTTILDINSGKRLKMTGEMNANTAKFNIIKTPRVVSKIDGDLTLESFRTLIMTGNGGFYGNSKSLHASAFSNITFRVQDNTQGIVIDGGLTLNRTYIPDTNDETKSPVSGLKYRLCYCENTEQLFLSEVTSIGMTCAVAKQSPC